MRSRTLSQSVSLITLLCVFARSTPHKIESIGDMPEEKRAAHVLNRLTFGARPGDVQEVMRMGVDKWIDAQLKPESIDESALNARLAPLRTITLPPAELAREFPPEPIIKDVANGKIAMPSEPREHAIYQAQLERYENKLEKKQNGDKATDGKLPAETDATQSNAEAAWVDDQTRRLMALPPAQRLDGLLKLPTRDQRTLLADVKGERRERFIEGMPSEDRETVVALNNPPQLVTEELLQAKVLRAVYSQRQLQEVMTDFWFNHFNVFINKGADRYTLASYEQDVIRPHALGKFEDLLVATAQSPAMLFYLDNWLSVGPNSDTANGIGKRGPDAKKRARMNGPVKTAKGKRNGLNENYGRELLELHTLGVNGGYTQKDVTEAARVLTGWTMKQPREGGGFQFDERMHEPGDKVVLGHRIKPHGEKEGLELLHILAHHPSTAKFVCTKIAMRFVADDPPPALVDRMAKTFLKKDGDIREVMRTMLKSPEFWAQGAYRAKVKTPLEFAVSSLRASGAEVTDAMPVARQLQNMGMPLYGMQPPTGYSMKADVWVNSSALLGRMNFSLALTSGRVRGTDANLPSLLPSAAPADSSQALAALEGSILGGDVSKQTHDTIMAQLNQSAGKDRVVAPDRPNLGLIAGLLLGSPEFQRR